MAQAEVVDAALGMGSGGSTLSAPSSHEDASWTERPPVGRTVPEEDGPEDEVVQVKGFTMSTAIAGLLALAGLAGSTMWHP